MGNKKKLFFNQVVDKKELKKIMSWAFSEFGMMKSSYLANQLKDLGFHSATQSGLSISIEDLKVPPVKARQVKLAKEKVSLADFQVSIGKMTEAERFQKIIYTWNTTSESLKDQVVQYFKESDPLNSIYMMAFSGARGNLSQVRQLVGMRGLMADPDGQIIDLPIVANFREGLTVTDYIISSYGARKGLVDTALRTADSGYLTRRLIDVAQDMITREKDCQTKDGISLEEIKDGETTVISLSERIHGRVLALPLQDSKTKEWVAQANEVVTPGLAKKILKAKIQKVVVRSPLTCSSNRSVCQQCYGWNLAYGRLVDLGQAVGIIAAQSIGEPGTQLTMRTFHTGGVFTIEPSRQIRAQASGKLLFSKSLETQTIRTQYGDTAFLTKNKGSLSLLTYQNLSIQIDLLPETLVMVANQAYVKKNDILFEVLSKTKKTSGNRAYQYVYAGLSGEVAFETKTKEKRKPRPRQEATAIMWVLSGQVYTLPFRSLLHLRKNKNTRKNHVVSETKWVARLGGHLKLLPQKKALGLVYSLDFFTHQSLCLEETKEKRQKAVLYGGPNNKIQFHTLGYTFLAKSALPSVGHLINLNYKTKTGGFFYTKDFSSKSTSKMGGSVFYLAESTYVVNQDIGQVFVQNGERIQAGKEIFKNCFANIGGIVDLSLHKKKVKELKIKPVKAILIKKEKAFKSFHQSLLYPGEVLFGSLLITQLSLSEVKTIGGQNFLLLYPLVRYEVLQKIKNEFFSFDPKTKHQGKLFFGKAETCFSLQKHIKANQALDLIKRPVFCCPHSTTKSFRFKLQLLPRLDSKKKKSLKGFFLENINLDNFLPKEVKKTRLKTPLLVEPSQHIEAYSNLSSFQVCLSQKNHFVQMKEQVLRKERKLYLGRKVDFKNLFFEESLKHLKTSQFIRMKEQINHQLSFKDSGYFSIESKSLFSLHKGQTYMFSKGANIKKKAGDLVQQGEGLGQLIYEKMKTGDIVQGLPRVEEILEARKPKAEAAVFASRAGILYKIQKQATKTKETMLSFSPPSTEYISPSSRLLVEKFEFVHVGQPLVDGVLSPHDLLKAYWYSYKDLDARRKRFITNHFNSSQGFNKSLLVHKKNSSYIPAIRSLRKIQAFLLTSVQSVYQSQGVNISDKHVELIIKRMTSKVEILWAGDSNLEINEVVDLKKVYYINQSLKREAEFRPILYGITKASLSTNSFISAASFQNTTRILTEAAIEGKTDWLHGLKENVIVGRLIPAGTGFNKHSDISHTCVKLPPSTPLKTKAEENQQMHQRLRQEKYMEIKGKIRFQLTK